MSILLLGTKHNIKSHRSKAKPRKQTIGIAHIVFTFVFGLAMGLLAAYQWHNANAAPTPSSETSNTPISQLLKDTNTILGAQENLSFEVVSRLIMANQMSLNQNYLGAQNQLEIARKILNHQYSSRPESVNIPILLYHKLPEDFVQQLDHLSRHGYNTVSMQQVGDYLQGLSELPSKPVVLSFDDGFSDNMRAAELLAAHGMRGTFYLIVGGDASQHCIGPERQRQDCGDDYLSWSQINELSKMSQVEIGVHTVDHADLPSLSPSDQMWQIVAAKNQLEQRTGRKLTTFAYPYGHFNSTTVELVRAAGFETAVTTQPGTVQLTREPLTLHRIRTTLDLQ